MAKEKKEVVKIELQDTIKELNKDYGENFITNGSDDSVITGVIPFNIPSLDFITQIGGVPRGRVIEFSGMDGTHKTYLNLCLIASEQQLGGICALVNAEFSFDPIFAASLGVDLNKLILVHPDSTEQAFNALERLAASGKVSLIVVDSFTALSPETEKANDFGASNMGVAARLNSQLFRKIVSKLSKSGTTLSIINQLREKLGGYVVTKTVPGGNALLFYASMRFECKKSKIEGDTEHKGINLEVKTIKNKFGIPYLKAEFEIIFGEGIDIIKDLINVAINLEIFEKKNAGWIVLTPELKLQGVESVKQHLLDNPEFMEVIESQIKQKINDTRK
jgi:recombination protein RecA